MLRTSACLNFHARFLLQVRKLQQPLHKAKERQCSEVTGIEETFFEHIQYICGFEREAEIQ